MGYLERLKKSVNAGAGTLRNQNNPESEGFLGSLGAPPGPFQKIERATAANDPGQKQPLVQPAATLTEGLTAHVKRRLATPHELSRAIGSGPERRGAEQQGEQEQRSGFHDPSFAVMGL